MWKNFKEFWHEGTGIKMFRHIVWQMVINLSRLTCSAHTWTQSVDIHCKSLWHKGSGIHMLTRITRYVFISTSRHLWTHVVKDQWQKVSGIHVDIHVITLINTCEGSLTHGQGNMINMNTSRHISGNVKDNWLNKAKHFQTCFKMRFDMHVKTHVTSNTM